MQKIIEHPYHPTPKQAELHTDPHRFKVCVWGRRSGKSTFAFMEAVQTCWETPNAKVWIICPTYGQAKDVYWREQDIMGKLLPEGSYVKKNDSELLILFHHNALLQFKGAENKETLRGSGLNVIILDEVAEYRYFDEIWNNILRPALADKGGRAIFIGTPKGYNHFYDLYERGQNNNQPQNKDWKSWRVATWDSGNPWTLTEVGKKEIEQIKSEKAEDYVMQEYGADFRKHTGLIFKEFDRDINIKDFDVPRNFQLECGMDFGYTNPTVFIASYFDDDDNWWIFDEYFATQKPIPEHAGAILALRQKYKNDQRFIVGDSANQQEIEEYRRYRLYISAVEKTNKSVLRGINRIADRLKINPITNLPRVFIRPNCVELIKEFERYRWQEKRGEDKNEREMPEKAYDHGMDAIRYIILHHTKQKEQVRSQHSRSSRRVINPLTGY